MDPRVKMALGFAKGELDKHLSVNEVSVRLRLSESRFEHLFKAQTGQAFKARLREYRLEKAKALLLDPTLRVQEVATAVGYNFIRNFTRDFKKRYGKSPSQDRTPPP